MNNIEEFEAAYNTCMERDVGTPVEKFKHPVPGVTYKYQHANDMLAFWNAARVALIAQLEAAQKERDVYAKLASDVGDIITLLQNNEWAENIGKTNVGGLLEYQITRLMNSIADINTKLLAAEAELSAANERTLAPVILEIANERLRQISVEGWTPEHDDQHSSGELAGAAGYYAKHVNARQWCFKNNPDDYQCEPEPSGWPWAAEWWKPKNPRSDLIRAAALIVAELERLDRAAGFTVEE